MREPLFTPFTLAAYRCEERLRAGGIGDLYLAVHLPTGSHRTIWKLAPEVLEDPETAEQLLQVQLRVQNLTHPNIVSVREIMQKDREIYVAADHHSGVSLRQLLLKLRTLGPLTPPVASFVVWQICQALDFAHHLKQDGRAAPLVHGALWPNNIVITFKGEVRLTDFGTWVIPRGAYSEEELSVRTHFSYRSPEHLNGETLTRSSDLFCVGILLFEMLTGRSLFLGKTLMETVQRVEKADLGALTGVPAPLQKVLRRCMAAKPAARYADVAGFVSELAVVVLGVGDRAVRQELLNFLNMHFPVKELPPLKPAPLPGLEDDETTNISPAKLTEILVELSRERTQPGDEQLGRRLASSSTREEPQEDRGEATRVDSLAPEMIDEVTPAARELDDESPTAVTGSPAVMPRWDLAPHRGAPGGGEQGKILPAAAAGKSVGPDLAPALFPPGDDEVTAAAGANESAPMPGPLVAFDTQETTTQASNQVLAELGEEEPTVNARPDAAPTVNARPDAAPTVNARPDAPPLQAATRKVTPARPPEAGDEIPTLNEKPFDPPGRSRELEALRAPPPPPRRGPSTKRDPLYGSADPRAATLMDAPSPGERGRPGVTGPAPALRGQGSPLPRPAPSPPARPTPPARPATPPARPTTTPPRAPQSPASARPPALSSTLPPVERTPPIESATPAEVPLVPLAQPPADSGLSFEGGNFSADAAAYQSDLASSQVSTFDPDAFSLSYSQSYDQFQRKRRLSPAHLMLGVAILVFLAAVAMLVRRIVSQRRAAVPLVTRPRDAGGDQGLSDARRGGDPQAQPLAPRLVSLRVESTPAAKVYLDGKLQGETPLDRKLKPDKQTRLVLMARGHKLHRQLLHPGTTPIAVKVRLTKAGYAKYGVRARAILVVSCGDDGRRIVLDEEETGIGCTGNIKFALKPGPHRIGFYAVETDRTDTLKRVKLKRRGKVTLKPPRI